MNTYRIFFRGLEASLPIGLHDFERSEPQRIRLDIVLHLARPEHFADDPDEVFDYDRVRDFVVGLSQGGQIELQEALCQAVVDMCREEDKVVGVAVRSAKPDVYPDTTEVGCCLTWGDASAQDFALVDMTEGERP